MVKFTKIKTVSIDSLIIQTVDLTNQYLFIKFKEMEGFCQDYIIIEKEYDISVYGDTLYIFDKGSLEGRIPTEDIDFIFSFKDGDKDE